MAYWRERTGRDAPKVEVGPELLLTNLLPIEALPTHINFYEFNGPKTEIKPALEKTGIPYWQFQRLVIRALCDRSLRRFGRRRVR